MGETVSFESHGTRVVARWFSAASAGEARPCIVMGHGFGATVASGLIPFAEHFQAAGWHALAFDYRHFGASDGEPRQLLSVKKQLEDWASAIAYARYRSDVSSVAVWGTSFGGGHSLVAGAMDGRVAAIVSQCPMMDGVLALKNALAYAGIGKIVRAAKDGLVDAACGALGLSPRMLRVVGPEGSYAAMATYDAEQYLTFAAPDFKNEVCARIALETSLYRPVRYASRVRCPVLVQICEKDSVAPIAAAEQAARRANAEVARYPLGHFDVYTGEGFERAVSDQIAFFRKHLRD